MQGGIVYRIPNGRRGGWPRGIRGRDDNIELVFEIVLDHGRAAVHKQLAAGKQSIHAVIAAKHHYVPHG